MDRLGVMQMTGSVSRLAGGPFESVRRTSQELMATGCDVSVCALRDEMSLEDAVEWSPVVPRLIDGLPAQLYGWSRGWRQALDREMPSVVHIQGLWLAHLGVADRWCRNRGRPLVVSPRGMLEPWAMQYKRWKKALAWGLLEARIVKRAACIHATSESEADAVRRLGISVPIAVIPNGIDIPNERPVDRSGHSKNVMLFLSRIHPKKGLPLLVEAWAKVRPKTWELAIVGPDECGHEAEVRALCQKFAIADCVRFYGPCYGERKKNLFRNSDVFVLPTYSENFGMAVAEALSWGLPVITTTGCPWRSIVEARCGWWVAPTVEGMVWAIGEAVATGRECRSEMGKRGRLMVMRDLSWGRVAGELREIYEWSLGQRAKPKCVVI